MLKASQTRPARVALAGQHYLAATEDLSATATSPLQLVLLKSSGPAEASIRRIDRMVLSTGLVAVLCGSILMVAVARRMTRPLEDLSSSVRAFATGDVSHRVPAQGPREVRQLSSVFSSMREEIQQKNRALLEAERLATIGRMASSVSHDLRHYLAAVYANSEFLASGRLSEEERAEIFDDIRSAVHGTTDMIESLLIFSRSGTSVRKSPEFVSSVANRAITLLRSHPDAEGVELTLACEKPQATLAFIDGKQLERALYNLLLNACQAARTGNTPPAVSMTIFTTPDTVVAQVRDNGEGVADSIRSSLFEPFVSEGRQKGTGLGLTLCCCIAEEHGGQVALLESRPGLTVFQLTVTRNNLPEPASGIDIVTSTVIKDEKINS